MSQKKTHTSVLPVSRRTGIDRRWIASDDHRPERRRGRDRRTTRKRSLSDPLVSNEPDEKRDPFPEIDPDPKTQAAKPTTKLVTGTWSLKASGAPPTNKPLNDE